MPTLTVPLETGVDPARLQLNVANGCAQVLVLGQLDANVCQEAMGPETWVPQNAGGNRATTAPYMLLYITKDNLLEVHPGGYGVITSEPWILFDLDYKDRALPNPELVVRTDSGDVVTCNFRALSPECS